VAPAAAAPADQISLPPHYQYLLNSIIKTRRLTNSPPTTADSLLNATAMETTKNCTPQTNELIKQHVRMGGFQYDSIENVVKPWNLEILKSTFYEIVARTTVTPHSPSLPTGAVDQPTIGFWDDYINPPLVKMQPGGDNPPFDVGYSGEPRQYYYIYNFSSA